jgi:hypothetical protein
MGELKTEDEWQRLATASAIAQARRIAGSDAIPPRAAVGSLSDIEWGWIVTAAIAGWTFTRAQQATELGMSCEDAIRTMTHTSPAPWQAGAVASCLPALASTDGLDWSKPMAQFSKDEMTALLWHSHQLVSSALACQREGGRDDIDRTLRPAVQFEADRALEELSDEVPF